MEPDCQDQGSMGQRHAPAGYEPPRVEQVLEARELEREILYAGDLASPR
jgi:hypothetical protein